MAFVGCAKGEYRENASKIKLALKFYKIHAVNAVGQKKGAGRGALATKSGTHALAMGKQTLLTVKTLRQVAVSKGHYRKNASKIKLALKFYKIHAVNAVGQKKGRRA